METVRSLPRNPDVVARHPSAEDLDAAQQLISSAQAGREHPIDRLRDETGPRRYEEMPSRGPYEADKFMDASIPYPSETGANPSEKASSPKSQKDTSFLGHSCRLVFGLSP